MQFRRPQFQRFALWTLALALLLAAYMASAPLVRHSIDRRVPSLRPLLNGVCAPLELFMRRPNLPGSRLYRRYVLWSYQEYDKQMVLTADPRAALDSTSTAKFAGTPLHDVVEYLGAIHACRIELDPDVDSDVTVTIATDAPLRDILQQVLSPHGLVADVAGERIVIGRPESVQRLVAEAEAKARQRSPAPWILLTSLLLVAVALVIAGRLLKRRGRIARDISESST